MLFTYLCTLIQNVSETHLVGQDLYACGVPLEGHVSVVGGLNQHTVHHLGQVALHTAVT